MGADFSRVRLDPLLDYARVELKQGGLLLDADANELAAIIDRRFRALASDTLGRATVSSTTPDAFKITAAGGTLQMGRGRLYVDGLLAECHGAADPAKREFDDLLAETRFADPIEYKAQPYLSDAPDLPTGGQHLVYLDVWDREVTHLEETGLIENAVGVETSSRVQTVWQVHVLEADVGQAATCESVGNVKDWQSLTAPSTGRLTTGTFEVPPTDDPCELPPTGGYRGLENQLYCVEIHNGGQPGAGATFKWSRDRVGSRVKSMVSGTELELATLGRDDVLRFKTGDWVEIIDDRREFAQAPGELRKITVTEATNRIAFAPALPTEMLPQPPAFPDSNFPNAGNLRVRRWDQSGKIFRTDSSGKPVQVQDLDSSGSTGLIDVPAPGIAILLENGVTVSFDSIGAPGSKGFRPGDYWVFAARTADASVELLDHATPRGVHHHYARLGIWDAASGAVTDCRQQWPPATGDCDCSCTLCVTPESHASGKLTIQDAVDKIRSRGGTICLTVGQYPLRAPVRIAGARSVRITGQGAATAIVAVDTAFIIERSAGISIDDIAIFSLGRRSSISVRTVMGLTLRNLAVAIFSNPDAQGAAIALGGLVAGANIHDNLLIAPDGIRALEPETEEAPKWLITAAAAFDSNVLLCRDAGIKMEGLVGHAFETRIGGNQVVGTREVGFSLTGLALPGASVRISGNNLQVHGPGIRCSTDGLWIDNNMLHAARDRDNPRRGSGIQLVTGLDKNGSNQAQLVANQIDGFPEAGIAVAAPVLDLLVKLNIIESCGNGIVMTDSASAGSVSIDNNHLRDIGPQPGGEAGGQGTTGIELVRTTSATISGNTLRRIGVDASESAQWVVGISAKAGKRARIIGNEITEVGPEMRGTVAGIAVIAPFDRAEVANNHVERDADFNLKGSDTAWYALYIRQPLPGHNLLSTLGNFTAFHVDVNRTLVLSGANAWVNIAAPGINVATGASVPAPSGSASVLGNSCTARGRVPAVDIEVGEVLFSDNRCELRANEAAPAVHIRSGTAVVNANRVLSERVAIDLQASKSTVIGNITKGIIQPQPAPPMDALNVIS